MREENKDRDLVAQTLAGNQEAYRELISRYRNAVYGIVLGYVDSFDHAEDLAQEAFIRGYYRLHTLKERDRFGGWLRRVVENLCRMEIRRKRILPMGDIDVDRIPDAVSNPEETFERNETRQQVFDALDRLPQKEREAVTLYYLDGERVANVSSFLGISQNAVKARLHRARKTLRQEMMTMTEKSLPKEKLGPEFAKGIEIRSLADLARLTDEELGILHDRIERWHLGTALASGEPETEVLRERFLDILPENDRRLLEAEIAHRRAHYDPYSAVKEQLVSTARRLQNKGERRTVNPPPEGGTVEVNRFDDMDLLQPREIQMVFRQVDTVDLARALMGKKAEREKAEIWAKANVSVRVWGFIEIEREFHKVSAKEVRGAQAKILSVVHELQGAKVIRPSKKGSVLSGRLLLDTFGDLAKLTNKEMQMTLRETETKDLAVALKGKGKGVRQAEKLVYRNVSDRVRNIIEERMAHIAPSLAEIRACHEKILVTARGLQILGYLRLGKRRPTSKVYEREAAAVAENMIERRQHSTSWTPRAHDLQVLMPLLAKVVRDEGVDKGQDRLRDVEDPVLIEGLRLLGDGLSRMDFEDALRDAEKKEMTRESKRRRVIYEGLLAIYDGEEPRKVAEILAEL